MNESSWDRIYIRDLNARCILGIFPEEREKLQEVLINIILYTDMTKAEESDSIEDTVDYKQVKTNVLDLVQSSSCFLVEKLAGDVAKLCLATQGVEQVTVTIDKPGALRFARSVGAEITRKRSKAD
ncbi:MAG: dihydroneopterin aldolase [Candidatus Hydrogenedentes bacterium]|nr:dihydroneopterin aldolase [Candidatus Hydrogenedentota bacterium]